MVAGYVRLAKPGEMVAVYVRCVDIYSVSLCTFCKTRRNLKKSTKIYICLKNKMGELNCKKSPIWFLLSLKHI